jgi:hypothetical protein
LRDHGLIRKAPNRHRYHLTDKGRQLAAALQAMLSASTKIHGFFYFYYVHSPAFAPGAEKSHNP